MKTEQEKIEMRRRAIFWPAPALFVGRSPILGMLPPHALEPSKISARAVCAYL
jgi:hypothetical protein